ncbi:hypothetical protein T08_15508 [Trichinella sp. T8]|nr:hypothetical protein T08_15508 [Trichinella sp. T8]
MNSTCLWTSHSLMSAFVRHLCVINNLSTPTKGNDATWKSQIDLQL